MKELAAEQADSSPDGRYDKHFDMHWAKNRVCEAKKLVSD